MQAPKEAKQGPSSQDTWLELHAWATKINNTQIIGMDFLDQIITRGHFK